jgi:hypothetical protein
MMMREGMGRVIVVRTRQFLKNRNQSRNKKAQVGEKMKKNKKSIRPFTSFS